MNASRSTETSTPQTPWRVGQSANVRCVPSQILSAHSSTPSSNCFHPRQEPQQGLSVFSSPIPTPSPCHPRSSGLRPSHPFLISHPQGRQPHQLFPAAGAPIGWRPAAPNINDTQEPGLEAQAREQTPTSTAPETSRSSSAF